MKNVMQKLIKLIKILIILIISVFLILFVIGLLFGDDEKEQDAIYTYEPKETKEYIPLDIVTPDASKIDEESIPDEEYSDSVELAMKNPNIDISPEDDYTRNIDRIIKEFKSEEYISIYFISEKGEEATTTFAKFKIKEIEGKEKYAFLTEVTNKVTKDSKVSGTKTSKFIHTQLTLNDALQDLNVNPGNTRFVYGVVHDDSIYSLKVEGQEPDEIIHYELFGIDCYLWYYSDLKSDHSGDTLSYTIEEK